MDHMAETFSQEFCSIAPCGAGGRIITGPRLRNCLVQVANGELTLIQAPSTLVANTPVAGVEIVTPPMLRKVGTGVILRLDRNLLAIEFDMVYRNQQAYARRAAGRQTSPLAGILRRMFRLSDVTSLRKAMRLARQLARDFTTALLAAGATDKAGTVASRPR